MMRNVTFDFLVKPDLVFWDKKKKWFIFQPNANLHTYTTEGPAPWKKVHEFPVSSRDVTNQTPPGQE